VQNRETIAVASAALHESSNLWNTAQLAWKEVMISDQGVPNMGGKKRRGRTMHKATFREIGRSREGSAGGVGKNVHEMHRNNSVGGRTTQESQDL